jgi:hypothetical protein
MTQTITEDFMLDFNVAMKPEKTKKNKKAEDPAPSPAARDPFDITPIRTELKKYEEEITRWERQANDLQILDEDSLRLGIEMASQAKKLGNNLEKFRKEKKEPFRAAGTAIDNAVGVYANPCEKIWKIILNPKINAMLTKQKLDRLEAERRAQEAARELQAKLDAESKEKNLPQVQVPEPVYNMKAAPVRTEEGSASQRKDWKARLEDINKVPREYLIIDWPAVNRAVRGGVRVIDGFVIEQVESLQIRT